MITFDFNWVRPGCEMGKISFVSAQTFREMTAEIKDAAAQLCQGRLLMVHEGGYSEAYVPFCGHAVLEALSGSPITAPDPMAHAVAARQPNARMQAVYAQLVEEMAQELGL